MRIANIITFIILLIGGLNWLTIGIFGFDMVAAIFGGMAAVGSRIVYILVGLSAIWLIISAIINRRINFPPDEERNKIKTLLKAKFLFYFFSFL